MMVGVRRNGALGLFLSQLQPADVLLGSVKVGKGLYQLSFEQTYLGGQLVFPVSIGCCIFVAQGRESALCSWNNSK